MTTFDRLAARLANNRLGQFGVLLAGPVAVYGLVLVVNAVSGTAFAAQCGIDVVFRETAEHTGFLNGVYGLFPFIDLRGTPSSACRSVPFTADATNQVLAATTGLAIAIYLVTLVRVRCLRQDLQASGVLTPASLARSGLGELLDQPPWRPPAGLRRTANVGLFAAGVIVSGLMYNWTFLRGPIFADLANSYSRMGSSGVTAELLRVTWWANHHHHPLHTALGILVGATGLYFAIKQGILFLKLAVVALRVRRLRDLAPVEFVPKWLDPDHGWRPAGAILSLAYLSVLVFLASFAAALYMLRTDEPGLYQTLPAILAAIATLGLVAPITLQITLVWTIRSLFGASVDQERWELKRRLDAADAAFADVVVGGGGLGAEGTGGVVPVGGALPLGTGRSVPGAAALPLGTGGAAPAAAAVALATAASTDDRLYVLTRATMLMDTPTNPLRLRDRAVRLLAVGPIALAGYKFFDEVVRAFTGS